MEVLWVLVLAIPVAGVVGLLLAINRWGRKHDRMGGAGVDRYTPGYADRQQSSLKDE